MAKVKEIAMLIDELRQCGENITNIADTLYEMFGGSETTQTAEVHEKTLTLEDVRAVLAEKSGAGFTADVKSLLNKYGADKLSDINPEQYQSLLSDTEVLGNAE